MNKSRRPSWLEPPIVYLVRSQPSLGILIRRACHPCCASSCSHSFLDRHSDLSNEARPLADKVNALIAIEFLPATHCGVIFYRVLCRRHVRRDIRRVLWCIISPLLPVSGFVFFCSRPVALCHVT
ncbi:hypothetical protein PISMIDRAFT_197431 [Pisolithus microcarpus 441]|uniref:Uncharacterized protein n=1 Tax=Pisolithus microcarpus 441 TaxID=765257 RepID=A0A0C9Z6Y3_9AGAM|nr:hypothetical protein PISMIDRAFT_197431 [Pisolithus microcarpus 441]